MAATATAGTKFVKSLRRALDMEARATAPVLTMKLLVDAKAQQVVFAEAGKEVVDFLFSLLALPLSAVTKLLAPSGIRAEPLVLQRHHLPAMTGASAMVGSFGNLYHSLEILDAAGHVCCRNADKDALLKPATTILQLIPAAPTAAAPAEAPQKPNGGQLFRCKGCSCFARCHDYATRVRGTACPVCKREMTTEVHLVEPDGGAAAVDAGSGSGSGGYVREMVTYAVMDDLSVGPISTISAVTTLASLGVTDISRLQAKDVEIGYKEGLAILKASLQSQMVLTDVFLGPKSNQTFSSTGSRMW